LQQRHFLGGLAWSSGNALVTIAAPLAVFVVFAHHVAQWQLGIFAYAMAWVEIVKALMPMGVYEALLSTDDHDAAAGPAATMVYAAAIFGYVVYVAIITTSQLWMPDIHRLYPYMLAIGLRVVFDVALQQPLAAVARRKDYTRLAIRSVTASLVCAVVGIGVCLTVSPVLGVAAYYILQSLVGWAIIATAAGALAPPSLSWSRLKPVLPTTFVATQVRSLGALNNFGDQVIAGWFIGPVALSLYNLGKRLEIAEITGSNAFSTVLFQPLLARRSDDALATDYRRCLMIITVLCGLPVAVFAANAPQIVALVFGARWLGAASIAAALAFSGLARAIGNVHGAYLSVNGENRVLRDRTLVSALSGMAIVAATGIAGLVWVAWALAIKNACVTAWSAWLTRRLAPPRFYLTGVIGLVGFAFLVAWLTRRLLHLGVLHLTDLSLAGLAASCLATTAAVALLYARDLVTAARSLALRRARS
jgi:PST family polysaccharide transporter